MSKIRAGAALQSQALVAMEDNMQARAKRSHKYQGSDEHMCDLTRLERLRRQDWETLDMLAALHHEALKRRPLNAG